ncbi:hypothetical protein ETI08_01020 [Macrococcoides goetzii]|nr:hypothetical protein [Macrococcus goetzii]TDM47745.1 hypothetical protein ETI08_01020 [Macrococcus goetzii]
MTENTNAEVVETNEVEELGFLEEITLVNDKGAERTITAPRVVPGRVFRAAKSLGYKERQLIFKNDGKGKYEKDEDGNYIPNESTEEIELGVVDLYENFIVEYFNNQFTVDELREGLDARKYEETLMFAYTSALGNPMVPKKK